VRKDRLIITPRNECDSQCSQQSRSPRNFYSGSRHGAKRRWYGALCRSAAQTRWCDRPIL